ncbi:MAG: response regulator transcription factor [Bacteroidota bacterium]
MKILIVDDEQDILDLLTYNLEKEGYTVFTAGNGKDAIASARKNKPDLVLLDVMMPEMDGIETCSAIREIPDLKNILIAFLTARSEDYSQIAGFESGADDYITKPIKPKVLISRIKALARRMGGNDSSDQIIERGGIKIDRERYLIVKDGKEITLPRKEFELLSLLFSKPGKVFKRESILESVWGEDVIVGDRTIDVHIRKLREKIGEDYIKTVKGIGYRFDF